VHRRFRDLARASDDALPLVPTPEVRLAMRYAREEAAAVGASKLEGQHVLLGVLRAATLPTLADAGVTLERARAHVDATTPRSRRFGTRPETGAMLAEPAREALRRGSRRIQAEHLLLGVLRTDSGAARTLRALGADPRGVEAALDALAEPSLR
jgi:ATP-dependent Clp protease ATP-binding subunit ClpA